MSEPTRERVRAAIGLVGGYWRPLAAVARLQEELGELAELLASDANDVGGLASELADLWIITTALSDQFLGRVGEPDMHSDRRRDGTGRSSRGGQASSPDVMGALVVAAGRIARIVNHYDGPKTPRTFEGWISLSEAVADFHRALAEAAHAHDVDLAKAVHAKLDAIPARDLDRFQTREHDPSTALSLPRFRSLAEAHPGLGADTRLWGSPDCSPDAACARVIAADLTSFTKASPWERLDAYLIRGPTFTSTALLHEWLTRLLLAVAAHDPSGGEQATAHVQDGVASPFFFNGSRLLVSVCDTPLAAGTFALLRVEHATDRPSAQ